MANVEQGSMLYLVNLAELAQQGNENNYPFLKSLADLSDDYFTISRLQHLAANPRNQLFVLLSPRENWLEDGIDIYCAIQIYYEGFSMSGRADPYPQISQHLTQMPSFSNQSKGAQIITLFSSSDDPSQCQYSLFSLNLLISYFNGEMVEQDTEELPEFAIELVYQLGGTEPKSIDYLGVYCGSSLDWLLLYQNVNFIQLFVGSLQGNFMGGPVLCAMIRGFNEFDTESIARLTFQTFRERFIRSMVYFKDDLEPSFTLRVLKFKNELISTTLLDEREMDSFINEFDFRRVAAFVNDRRPNIELVNHLLREFGIFYFEGRLPFPMNEDEEKVLILMGLLSFSMLDVKEKMNLRTRELNSHLKSMYGKLLEYYYILFPQY